MTAESGSNVINFLGNSVGDLKSDKQARSILCFRGAGTQEFMSRLIFETFARQACTPDWEYTDRKQKKVKIGLIC